MKNPKFDFYVKLLKLIQSVEFNDELSREIIEIYHTGAKDQISLDTTFVELHKWHECFHREPAPGKVMNLGQWTEGVEVFEEMVEAVFEDLAPQMRSKPVRDLHHRYKRMANIPDDLFIRIRKVKALDENFAAITVVTDDVDKFRLFFTDPDKFAYNGEVHYSEANEEVVPEIPNWELWKTITVGTLESAPVLCRALKRMAKMEDYTERFLCEIPISRERNDLNLALVSTLDPLFEHCETYEEICAEAIKLGLQLCPLEVGPQARIKFPEQKKGEILFVASEPIVGVKNNVGEPKGPCLLTLDGGDKNNPEEGNLWIDLTGIWTVEQLKRKGVQLLFVIPDGGTSTR